MVAAALNRHCSMRTLGMSLLARQALKAGRRPIGARWGGGEGGLFVFPGNTPLLKCFRQLSAHLPNHAQALNMAAAALDRHSSMGNMGMASDPGSLEDLVGRAASLMSGAGRASPEPVARRGSRADAGRNLMGDMGRAASFQTALEALKRHDGPQSPEM